MNSNIVSLEGSVFVKIQESAENYLETILVLKRKQGVVRSIDIATEMGFSKPSVSVAMKQFRENGYIIMQPDGAIELTKKGLAKAESVYERHRLLTEYLMAIGVSEETAEQDACRIEHVLSEETFDRLKEQARRHNLEF